MNYDKSIEELQKIVDKLSNEKLGIEESLDLYSRGIVAAKEALNALNDFKGKIEILNNDLSELEIDADVEEDDDNEDDDD